MYSRNNHGIYAQFTGALKMIQKRMEDKVNYWERHSL